MSEAFSRWLLRRPTIRTIARRLVQAAQPLAREALRDPQAPAAAAATQPDVVRIPEITTLAARRSERPLAHARLNLLIPGLSERHVFGGIATALHLFDRLRSAFHEVRIIVLDELRIEPRRDAYYSGWPVHSLADLRDCDPAGPHVVVCGNRATWTLPVGDGDLFMATIWWSAHLAHELLAWQQQTFPGRQRLLVYLIQDFEPGFYPWSSRYALAEATYRRGEGTIALVNSGFLADFLAQRGYRFAKTWVFEPRLSPALAALRSALARTPKARTLLVYGRPGTERNAFALAVAGLRYWVAANPSSVAWRVVSAGEEHAVIELGRGVSLQPLGKLGLDGYARLLAEAAVGVSLMISPHPSYPPLEMAAFGGRVVTNAFGGKDLSALCPAIASVDPPTAEALASAIGRQCRAWEERAVVDQSAFNPTLVEFGGAFLDGRDPFDFAGELGALWLSLAGLPQAVGRS